MPNRLNHNPLTVAKNIEHQFNNYVLAMREFSTIKNVVGLAESLEKDYWKHYNKEYEKIRETVKLFEKLVEFEELYKTLHPTIVADVQETLDFLKQVCAKIAAGEGYI